METASVLMSERFFSLPFLGRVCETRLLTLLGLQFRSGDKPVKL